MICPDLIKTIVVHNSNSSISDSFTETITKYFEVCSKNQCPCYVKCNGNEFCTKYSKEFK